MKRWNIREMSFLKKNYIRKGAKYCAKYLNREWKSVSCKANKLGLFKPKKHVNIDYFLNIKLPEIAYFLGLFWADGWMRNSGRNKYQFGLTILKTDMNEIKTILSSFADWTFVNIERNNRKKATTALIGNKYLREFLAKYDFRKKSQTTPSKILSHLPTKLHKFFWRGFFDGDGYIRVKKYFRKNKPYTVSSLTFTGSYNQNWKDLEFLLKKMNIKYRLRKYYDKNSGNKCSKIEIQKVYSIVKLGNYIFKNRKNDNIGFSRKFNKLNSVKKHFLNMQKLYSLKNYPHLYR